MSVSRRAATQRAKDALRNRFGVDVDAQGYVRSPQANLVKGVRLEQFEDDLRRGDGNELRMKFCAVHSSAALAVNCFAPFKDRPERLALLNETGAVGIEFEKQLSIFQGRRPANLDVWIDQGKRVVAVESKLLEYFKLKKPNFGSAYDDLVSAVSDAGWWAVFQNAKVNGLRDASQHLDRAQLLKHYFGLRRLRESSPGRQSLTLLYLFWEPLNWQEVAECVRHRQEVELFADQVAGGSIEFKWMTYGQLWNEWALLPALREHASELRARYEVHL